MVFPVVTSPIAACLCSVTLDHLITQLVVHPTRWSNNLDLIFTNSTNSFSAIETVDNLPRKIMTQLILGVRSSPPPPPQSSVYKKGLQNIWKAAWLLCLSRTLAHVPWDQYWDNETVWTCWRIYFFALAEFSMPMTLWKWKKVKHWVSADTFHLICVKQRILVPQNKASYFEINM